MSTLVVATSNPGKLREFAAALTPRGFDVRGLDSLGDVPEVAETGETFEANARLKAEGYSQHTDLPVLADDSGLEVDALGGEPGVHSARYGGPELDDAGRNQAVLAALQGVPDTRRSGRFHCVLAVALHGKTLATFDGTVEGRILEAPRGTGGFGYDSIFYYPPLDTGFGELTREQKQQVSHRGKAIAELLAALSRRDSRLVRLGAGRRAPLG